MDLTHGRAAVLTQKGGLIGNVTNCPSLVLAQYMHSLHLPAGARANPSRTLSPVTAVTERPTVEKLHPAIRRQAPSATSQPRFVNAEAMVRLERTLGARQARVLVHMSIDGYELSCEAMVVAADPHKVGRQARQISGSADMLGLGLVSNIARQIEAGVEMGRNVGGLVHALRTAVSATRRELERTGAL